MWFAPRLEVEEVLTDSVGTSDDTIREAKSELMEEAAQSLTGRRLLDVISLEH